MAKDSNADASTRASAAKDAVGDKVDETKVGGGCSCDWLALILNQSLFSSFLFLPFTTGQVLTSSLLTAVTVPFPPCYKSHRRNAIVDLRRNCLQPALPVCPDPPPRCGTLTLGPAL